MENLLPQKTRILWQIRIASAFILIIGAVAAFIPLTVWMLLPSGIILIIALIFLFWYIPAYFKSYQITVKAGTVIIDRGVFIKTSHIMPFPRLVFAQSFSTPLSKRFGLTAVALKAARGMVLIPEMYTADALRLLESISKEQDNEA